MTPDREQLETERDFLLQSLDDLETERETGAIDDESYAQLHDDYTARAAATIRALRDGVDARPEPPPPATSKRRLAVIAAIVVFALVAGVALASALGARLPGETASGNSQEQRVNAAAKDIGEEITALQKEANAHPDDYEVRLRLADVYARNNDLPTALEQWDAAISIDARRPEAHAQAGRALYLVSEQLTDRDQQAKLVGEAKAAFDKAIEVGPDYPDSYLFRAVLEAATLDIGAARADVEMFLAKAPADHALRPNGIALQRQLVNQPEPTSTTVPSSP
jgi:cytochrome c-type biogenesis protein CcmH/NrfG